MRKDRNREPQADGTPQPDDDDDDNGPHEYDEWHGFEDDNEPHEYDEWHGFDDDDDDDNAPGLQESTASVWPDSTPRPPRALKLPKLPRGSKAPLPAVAVLRETGTVKVKNPTPFQKLAFQQRREISIYYEDIIQQVNAKLYPTEVPEVDLRGKPLSVVGEATKRFLGMEVLVAENINWDVLKSNIGKALYRTDEQIKLMSSKINRFIEKNVVIRSSDHQDLLVFWRGGMNIPFGQRIGNDITAQLSTALGLLIDVYPPHRPSPNDIRHEENIDDLRARLGSAGIYHFCYWYEQARQKYGDPIMSTDVVSHGTHRFEEVVRFFEAIAPIQQVISILMHAMDPFAYGKFYNNFQKTATQSSWKLFGTSRRSCYHGLALLINLTVRPHRDKNDTTTGWTAMTCEGNFTGGLLVVPELGVKINFRPGDVIFLRASMLEHYLEDWEGRRSSLVFLTHADVAKSLESDAWRTTKYAEFLAAKRR